MKKLATRSAQWPLTAEFVFNYNDWVVDSVDGVKKTFGSTVANSVDPTEPGLTAGTGLAFDCVKLPRGAYITGAEVLVDRTAAGRLAVQFRLLAAEGIALRAAARGGLDAIDATPAHAVPGREQAHLIFRVMDAAAVTEQHFHRATSCGER